MTVACADIALQVRRARRDALKDTFPDPVLHHVWAPSRTTIDRHRSIHYPLTINGQSWVETYDVSPAKPRGTYRAFYVGDSTTQGVVAPERKMVEIVERELNRRLGHDGLRFEVINTGTSSYSFLNYYLLIKTKILDYAPDLIVINVDMSDVVNDCVYRRSAERDEGGAVMAIRPPEEDPRFQYFMSPEGVVERKKMPAVYEWFAGHSGIFYYVNRFIDRRQWLAIESGLNTDRAGNWMAKRWTPEIERNVEASMGVLRKTIRMAQGRGVKIGVTTVPHYGQYTGQQSARPHEMVRMVCEEAGVPCLDTHGALADRISGSRISDYYWSTDPSHFNVEGNRLWAEAQSAFLLDSANGLLPVYPEERPVRVKEG